MLQRRFSWALQKSQSHPEFNLTSHIYKHKSLGSNLVHLEAPDPHKAFGLMFRTTPTDDTGVAHCLEHIALCGSQKYPVRDPFMKMLSRSLNSYMNAWTGSDFTMYPFSTKNPTDFSNLLSVYLDASFFPLLSHNDFLQEAWRIEYNQQSLEFKGVVFNEMKGKASDPNDYLLQKLISLLMPGTTYEFNSGGDPLCIPQLKYEDLLAFHQKFYHPSNSTFFFYGDMDIKQYLQELEEKALNRFKPISVDTEVKIAKKLKNMDQITLKVPPDPVATDPSKPCKYAMSFLTNEASKDPYTTFVMNILSTALFNSQDSPMYKALLESGLGNNYVYGNGYDHSTRQSTFTIGLNGISQNQDKVIEATILATLKEISEQGFNPKIIESALHQVEIRNKEVKSNYGLLLISSMIPFALHGQDPLVPLYINSYVERLRLEMLQEKPVFQDLIKKYLLDNSHCVKVLAVPDPQFVPGLFTQEKNLLSTIQEKLTTEDSKKIEENTTALLLIQDQVQNVDLLPSLKVDDISRKIDSILYESENFVSGIPVKYIIQPTNGISYIRLKFDVYDMPEDLRDTFPLYKRLVNSLGTRNHSYNEFDIIKDLYTVSGITASIMTSSSPDSIESHSEQFTYQIAFLDRNVDNAFDILTEFLTQIRFDENEHLTNLIQRSVKSRTEDLLDSGNSYGSSLATSALTASANSYERLRILKHDCELAAQMLKAISAKNIINDLSQKLKRIHEFIIRKKALEVLVHTSKPEAKQTINSKLEFLENSLKLTFPSFTSAEPKSEIIQFKPFIYQAYFTLPIQVNYVTEAFLATHYTSDDYPALRLLCEIMSMKSLLKEVREKGGAYGASASVDAHSGTICLSSFRDPNTLKTYNAFEKAINDISEGKFSQRDIDESKLGVFGRIDRPVPIYERGVSQFFYGISEKMRQEFREKLIDVNKEQICKAARVYLAEPLQKGLSSKVIFGSENVDKKGIREAGWKVQNPIDVVIS